jgi:hypothetical protein
MSTEVLKKIYRAFDHTARLEDTTLYVKRERAPSERIKTGLSLDNNKHWIFCGSIGSGKSSELAYLGHLLTNEYFVVGLDLYQSVDDVLTIRPAEVLMLIGAAAVRTVEEWFGGTIPKDQTDALRQAFLGVLAETARGPEPSKILEGVALLAWGAGLVAAGNPAGGVESIGKGVVSAVSSMGRLVKGKQRTPLGGLTRPSLREGDSDVVALMEAVNTILQHIEWEYGRPPIVLVDGLDKLDSIETIRPLFCTSLLSGIHGSSVYSAPITMMLQTEWQTAASYFERERLTNLVVVQPSQGVSVEAELVVRSRELMHEVVARRLKVLGLPMEDVFEDGVLDTIITESGGVLRTLVHLVRQAAFEAIRDEATRILTRHVTTAIDELAHEFQITMNGQRRAELETIRAHGEPSGNETAFELLLGNYVLPYRNGHSWWAPAPLVSRCL